MDHSWRSRLRARLGERYAVGVLFTVYCCSFIDRQILNILAEPIKADLALADWQIGLLSGLAFSLFYAVLGIPLGRWADRPGTHRPRLIAQCLALWSAMTMLCAAPTSFLQLVLARAGVGVGEAGCSPAAHSLISDIVPAERRASAMGVYALAIPVGKLLGLAGGGWIAQALGWRAAFLAVGAPGLLLAVVVWATVREPRRLTAGAAAVRPAGFLRAMADLARIKTLWRVALACALMSFLSLGEAAFLGSFLIRVHHLSVSEAGLMLGLALGIGGGLGSWGGGRLCDRFSDGDPRGYVLLPGVAGLLGGVVLLVAISLPQARAALLLLTLSAALTSCWYGPAFSVIQGLVPPDRRATASAGNLLIGNLIGMGLGPLAVGLLSDRFNAGFMLPGWTQPGLGPAQGLRWALAIAALAVVVAFAFFAAAGRSIRADMAAATGSGPGPAA